jgi:hypothetical protein
MLCGDEDVEIEADTCTQIEAICLLKDPLARGSQDCWKTADEASCDVGETGGMFASTRKSGCRCAEGEKPCPGGEAGVVWVENGRGEVVAEDREEVSEPKVGGKDG